MKLGLVTKIVKRNTTTLTTTTKIDNNVVSTDYDIILIFLIQG